MLISINCFACWFFDSLFTKMSVGRYEVGFLMSGSRKLTPSTVMG